jgi:RNA polymerase sigma factor (sigma-70 family)
MEISRSAWEQTQWGLVDDFLDLFLPPVYDVVVEVEYPSSPAMKLRFENLAPSIEFPESKLIRLESFWNDLTDDLFSHKIPDWAVLFAFDVLQGFGHEGASKLRGTEFDGLKQLANTWGFYMAREFKRVFERFEFFTGWLDLTADLLLMIRQLSPRDLGEVIRGSVTPSYIRAAQIATYQFALFNGDRATMRESQSIIQASDAEIQSGINNMFKGRSTKDIGAQVQRLTIEVASAMKEIFSSTGFKKHYLDVWPITTRQMSWYVGYRLYQNLEYDPVKVTRLLEAIGRFGEIAAVMEQYRYRYDWQGDRDKAIVLGWQAVAPKYFRLSGQIENIREDEQQEKLIGLAEGLKDYTNKNPVVDALTEGFLGKLGAYLAKAGENQEMDYVRKQTNNGNRVLSEAKYAENLHYPDREEDGTLSDEEILSRAKERLCPSGDLILEVLESQETLEEWKKSLTDKQRTAVVLMYTLENQQKVAEAMGISQPEVSQLLREARKKYLKIAS